MSRTSKRNFRMAGQSGLIKRHRCPSVTGSMFLLGIVLLCAESITARTTTDSTETTEFVTSAFSMNSTNATSTTQAPSNQGSTINASATKEPTTEVTITTITTTASASASTNKKPGSTQDMDTTMDPTNGGNRSTQKINESPTERIGSIAIAGLCLVIVGLLLIAVNGYVLFKSKMGSCNSCSSRQGMFHVLQMSTTKKDRANDDDVEDNFKEDDDVDRKTNSSTSLNKESPVDEAPEQNGDVHVKVDVEDTAESSKNKTDDKDAKKPVENDDDKGATAAAADVVDKNNEPEDEVEKKNETVVTVTIEGGNGNKNEP